MHSIFLGATVVLIAGCAQLPTAEVPYASTTLARAVVFDIDGTLTPAVRDKNEVRPDAAKALRMYFEKGYKIIYLSARVSLFQSELPAWLNKNGFPESSIHVSDTNDPTAFKTRVLKEYTSRGWRLVGGYGDSSTDFKAYADAGIPKSLVFALLRKGETTCQPKESEWQACLHGWSEHLSFIESRQD